MGSRGFSQASVAAPFVAALVLAACQTTTGGEEGAQVVSTGDYNIFWDQGDHLKELVEVHKYDKAAELYAAHKVFFAADPAKYRVWLKSAADALNRRHAPELADAAGSLDRVAWPRPAADWKEIKAMLADAAKALAAYESQPLIAEEGFRAAEADRLKLRHAMLEKQIGADAAAQFALFDHFGETAFHAAYPIQVDVKALLGPAFAALRPRLGSASPKDIARFAAHYPKDLVPAEVWHGVGDLYLAAAIRQAGPDKAAGLSAVLAALADARRAGLEPKRVPDVNIGFVEITSRSLLKHGQIEFPAQVDVDLPFRVTKSELDGALTEGAAGEADYLVVFDVALAKASRRISSTKKMPSKMLTGHRTQQNPAYHVAQNEVNQAQIDLQRAALSSATSRTQTCYGGGCIFQAIGNVISAAGEMVARNKVHEAMEKLKITPMTIDVPIYQSYRFDRANLNATKKMTVHYYVIDRRAKRYFKSTFDVEEKKTFEVAYSVHQNDPDRDKILKGADTDEKVASWEEAPSTVKLSQLVDHYLKNQGEAKALPPLAMLREQMLKDKNAALARYEAMRYDARPLNDPRFDSVVVVYVKAKERAALGSGFFVTPDVVLTNFHVVEGATFVEMRTYDGQETFGKVVGQDAIRDLALVKVQSRGKPVRFFSGRTLDLGATVEAIGHPKGLEFSITRGVISAVRRQSTVAIPGGGGKNILFIQTDSPINAGNSGGPLFLDDRVVGVNTQGARKSSAEGLNFSVHYSEVLDFLGENLPGFSAQAGG